MDRLVAGYCVVHDRQQPKYLRHFYVKEEYRRKGVARRAFGLLLEALNVEEGGKIDVSSAEKLLAQL